MLESIVIVHWTFYNLVSCDCKLNVSGSSVARVWLSEGRGETFSNGPRRLQVLHGQRIDRVFGNSAHQRYSQTVWRMARYLIFYLKLTHVLVIKGLLVDDFTDFSIISIVNTILLFKKKVLFWNRICFNYFPF